MDFTAEQLAAIDIARRGSDASIVAGPGSGKTTVLVERYRQLIASGIEPSEILAITFTEKAAANMRTRLAEKFAKDPETLAKLERASVSTIHGFCVRLLKDHATEAGVDPEFSVLDEQLGVLEQARALRETLDRLVDEKPDEMARLLNATGGMDLEELIPPIYDTMRSAGMRPRELRKKEAPKTLSIEQIRAGALRFVDGLSAARTKPQKSARDKAQDWIQSLQDCRSNQDFIRVFGIKGLATNVDSVYKEETKLLQKQIDEHRASLLDNQFRAEHELLIEIFERFDDLFRLRKNEIAKLDYNDLEFYAVQLLSDNPHIRRDVNKHFQQVMTDEFQDTSAQQATLISLVRGPDRFYAVGDPNQSIYSFRHASPAVFKDYVESVKSRGGHAQELVQNWRSRSDILLATQFILKDAAGITPRPLVQARKLPERDHPYIEILICVEGDQDEIERGELEAQWVVNRIAELRATLTFGEDAHQAKLNDFAILVRNTGVLKPFLAELTKAGFDYNLNRRDGFFEVREARDLLHLLRIIYNPRDQVSLLAVLRSDFAGVSDQGLLRLKLHREKTPLADALSLVAQVAFDPEDRRRVDRFHAAFTKWREAAAYLPVDRLLLRALDEMGVVWDPRSDRGANIEKFLNIARSYEQLTLGEFVTFVEAMRKANAKEADAPPDETRDAVQIMTTHAAKGLEFPVVILAGMHKGVQGDDDALNFTPQLGLGVKWRVPGDEKATGIVYHLNKAQAEATAEEESNRLLYVALTRAQEHLILSWTQGAKRKPSEWARTVGKAFEVRDQQPLSAPEVRTARVLDGFEEKEFSFQLTCTAVPPYAFATERSTRVTNQSAVLTPPPLTGQFDPNTTATALAQFAACPRKYYLAGYLGWNRDLVSARSHRGGIVQSRSAADLGTQVHRLLADLDVLPENPEAVHLALIFDESALGRRAAKAKRVEKEWDFIFAVEDLIVRGTIDLWFEDAHGLTLVDYKTDNVSAAEAVDRAGDYALQLAVYAQALQRATGRAPDNAFLHFLRPDVTVPVEIKNAPADVGIIARSYIDAQQKIDFPLNAGPHCRRCDFYRTICPARLTASEEQAA